jgi:aminoglycoside phosphotransferase (APT) family kinase protein
VDSKTSQVAVVDWESARIGDPPYYLAIVTAGVRRPLGTTGLCTSDRNSDPGAAKANSAKAMSAKDRKNFGTEESKVRRNQRTILFVFSAFLVAILLTK